MTFEKNEVKDYFRKARSIADIESTKIIAEINESLINNQLSKDEEDFLRNLSDKLQKLKFENLNFNQYENIADLFLFNFNE